MATGGKAEGAWRTIGELSQEVGLPQHRLRYWETRFPQLKPLQRGGQRRYYRPEDVDLVRRIDRLLNHEGYTIAGAQKLLASEGSVPRREAVDQRAQLRLIRDRLRRALSQ